MFRILSTLTLLLGMLIVSSTIRAQEPDHHADSLKLPPDLLALLQAEMREISAGIQVIPGAIVQADWETLLKTSESLQSSYIMARALTPEQAETLESSLPARFKQIDSDFHQRAGELAKAARAHDFELASYHYSRLVESCAQCHSLFATTRFPAFGPAQVHAHKH